MAKNASKTTPSFITELPLEVSPASEAVLLRRLEVARQIYNACLSEALRRVKLIRQSKDFNQARSLKVSNPQRKVLFKRTRDCYGFSEYALHSYSTTIKHSWLGDHIDSNTVQKLATRAYKAVEKVLFGKSKKVRFKGKNQMDSVEGKSNKAGIRWQGESVEWNGLRLKALITDHEPVILHGLNSKVKYVRLVRRKISGKNRFYAQLVCEGKPFVKPKNTLGIGDVGIDIRPSTIAIVAKNEAHLKQFVSELKSQGKQIRRLQRKMDRSRRANNPDNFNSNGTVKKGKKPWNSSKSYLKICHSKANLERKLAGHRKSLHGELVNDILRTGDTFKLEKLSDKAFQKLFGSSVGKHAPGMFVSHLKNKAARAGGKVVEIPTYNTKLSQTCQCGRVKKKSRSLAKVELTPLNPPETGGINLAPSPFRGGLGRGFSDLCKRSSLSERIHQCECGVIAQRDLYSALLAKYIEPDTFVLQVSQLVNDWQSAELRLQAAWRTATDTEPVTGRVIPSSFGRCPELERVAAEVFKTTSKSQDAVGEIREPERGRL